VSDVGGQIGIVPPADFDWQHWVDRWERMQERYLVRRRERFAALVALIDATQARVERVLDLGCGPGSLTLAVLDAFPQAEVYGIDYDPSVLVLAQARLAHFGTRVHLIQADLQRAAWVRRVPAPIEAVISSTALHWLEPDVLAALYCQIAGLLAPGGILLNADHVGSEHAGVQRAWEQHRKQERADERRIKMGEPDADDWGHFWDAYGEALGYRSQQSLDGWEHGVEEGLPLSWHLDQLRACGFCGVDCFARWDCDALYGGVKERER
jgi:SAM-dependent methyltransferase